MRLRVFVSPQIPSLQNSLERGICDAGRRKPESDRRAAGLKQDARVDALKAEKTLWSYRLPAAPLSSENH
jgi:hypothetical protein